MRARIRASAKGCTEPVKGKPGTYRLYFSLGKDEQTGKYLRSPKRTYHCKSKNPKNWDTELKNALSDYRSELEGESALERGSWSVSDYADEFHRMREGTFGSPLAYEREGYDVRHIRELFGGIGIDALRPDDIRRAYATARERGRFKEGEIRRIHTKLKQVMQDAVDNELIQRNPCSSIKLPKANVEARQSLSVEEASRLLSCLDEEGLSPGTVCTMLLLQCGLRKGEALGLSWEDYDPEERRLRINKQFTNDKKLRSPKSKASRRVVSVGNSMAEWLERWRELQRKELAKYSIQQAGDTPIVHGVNVSKDECGLHAVVVRVDGHNYSRWFRDFCVDNGFGEYEKVTNVFMRNGKERKRGKHYRGLVPHALRHTQATLLIGEGADVKTVQARLGHASPNTTLSIYAHAIDANDRKAAATIDSVLVSSAENIGG